jgi:hypothetical protein
VKQRKVMARKMSRIGSLQRAIRDIEAALASPYKGIMYDAKGKPIDGDWVNGIRAPDARLVLQALRGLPV